MSAAFDRSWAIVVGIEAGYTADPKDPGNWTPDGRLKGTKYGISAHSFPNEDIVNMTLDRAKSLAKPIYWDAMRADELPVPLALIMFDSAFNESVRTAVKHLQTALKLTVDGVIGDTTMHALQAQVAAGRLDWVLVEYTTQRNLGYTQDSGFPIYSHSWFFRTAEVLLKAPGMLL